MKAKGQPKYKQQPSDREVRAALDPNSYLKETPVWRFRDFDWEGPWGHAACIHCIGDIRKHIEQHLANFETMTWDEIVKASGAKRDGKGNNHHSIPVDKFTKPAKERLKEKGILADTLFSLRLDQCTRVYGVREGHCLRLVFFDPHHCDHTNSAYRF